MNSHRLAHKKIYYGWFVIAGLGPYAWGWIADRTGSYLLNCPVSGLCYVVVVLSLALIRLPADLSFGRRP